MAIEKQLEKFVFLITDGSELLMFYGYGKNLDTAKVWALKNLNTSWSIVEDSQAIKSFIAERKAEVMPDNLGEKLINQWMEFDEDLNQLESRLNDQIEDLSLEEYRRYELISSQEKRLWEDEQAIIEYQERGLI